MGQEQSNLAMAKQGSEDGVTLPKRISLKTELTVIVTLVKMAQEFLPEGLNLSRGTHDLIVSCAQEFIHLLTFQANEICQKETNNGYIALQHVIRACEELGFEDFVGEIEVVTALYERELRAMQKVLSGLFLGADFDRRKLIKWDGGVMGLSSMISHNFKLNYSRSRRRDSWRCRWIQALDEV